MKILATEARDRSVWSVPRINRNFYFVIALMALVALFHPSARANSSLSGQIDGTVLDQNGASIGLTGQQVVHLINGVRFNNSTFRPGANQYTALIEHDFADRIEVVRGPGSTQYGSDSLGGTINVLTRSAQGADSFGIHGNVNTFFASADLFAGLSAKITGSSERWGFLFGASGRRTQDLRTGGGLDSHSVVPRLLGISSKSLGDRLQDTAYGQYNANAKLQFKASDADVLSFEYLRGTQLSLRYYDQLNGASLVPRRLTAHLGIRYSLFNYSQSSQDNPVDAAGRPTVPDVEESFDDVTFNTGLTFTINPHINITGNVSRGFRAPNVSDFAATGLSGLGFEVSPDEGVRLGGSTSALDSARRLTDVHPLEPIKPEQLYSYELISTAIPLYALRRVRQNIGAAAEIQNLREG